MYKNILLDLLIIPSNDLLNIAFSLNVTLLPININSINFIFTV